MNASCLLKNIHEGVDLLPDAKEIGLVQGNYEYYHYLVDGVNDKVPVPSLYT